MRLATVVLEHWYSALRGLEAWKSPNFFHPTPEVLSYSDSVLVFALPYIPLRMLGVDPMTAHQWALPIVSALGYAGMIWLLAKTAGVPWPIAVTGALIFSFSRYNYIFSVHSQMYATALLPWLVILCCEYARRIERPSLQRMPIVTGFFALLSLTALSAMYVVWFLALIATVAVPVAIPVLGLRYGFVRVMRVCFRWIARNWLHMIVSLYIGCILLLPVAIVYGGKPALLLDSHWPIVLESLPVPLFGVAGYALAITGVVSTVVAIFRLFGRGKAYLSGHEALVMLIAGGILFTCWALMLRYFDGALWRIVFDWFPGGRSIRVVFRFHQVLTIVVVPLAALGLASLWRRDLRLPLRSRKFQMAILVLCAWLLNEQRSDFGVTSSKTDAQARLDAVARVPPGCESFFIASDPQDTRKAAFQQVEAMLVAQRDHVPTINGYSGRFPTSWDLWETSGEVSVGAARNWAERHQLRNVCVYRADQRTWNR